MEQKSLKHCNLVYWASQIAKKNKFSENNFSSYKTLKVFKLFYEPNWFVKNSNFAKQGIQTKKFFKGSELDGKKCIFFSTKPFK